MPVVAWPAPLLDRIIADRWVLFLGSGVSATCKNNERNHPPTCTDLLSSLCGLISDTRLRRIGEELIREHDLLSAADHIRYSLAQEDNLTGYEQAIRSAVEGPAADLRERRHAA